MNVIVAKAAKRAREERKETVFFHGKNQITEERIETFKKRKTAEGQESASPSAETPANVIYYTPQSEVANPSGLDLDGMIESHPEIIDLTSDPSLTPRPMSKIPTQTEQSDPQIDPEAIASSSNCNASFLSPPSKTVFISQNEDVENSQASMAEDCGPPGKEGKFHFHLGILDGGTMRVLFRSPVGYENHQLSKLEEVDCRAKQALSTALKLKENGELDEARCHLLLAIYLYKKSRNRAPLHFLHAILDLGQFYDSQGLLVMPIASFCRTRPWIRFAFERPTMNSSGQCPTLRGTGAFSKAEKLCQKSLSECASWTRSKCQLRCYGILGDLLGNLGQMKPAKQLLLAVLARCLKEGWVDEIAMVVESLLKLESKANHDDDSDLLSTLGRLSEVLRCQDLSACNEYVLPCQVVLGAVKVAISYSKTDGADGRGITDMLLSSILSHIEILSDSTIASQKSQAYFQFHMFHLGQRRWKPCLDSLLEALQCASEGLGHDLAASLFKKGTETLQCYFHNFEMDPWTSTVSCEEHKLDDSFQHQPLKYRQALLDENISILINEKQRLADAEDLLVSRLGKLCSTLEVVLREFAETSQEQSQEASLLSVWKPLGPMINVVEEDWAAISS